MSPDDEASSFCDVPLLVIKRTTLAISILLMTTTLILIPFHRRLRKQHYIFPYNLVLSDLIGAMAFVILEAGAIMGSLFKVVYPNYCCHNIAIVIIREYNRPFNHELCVFLSHSGKDSLLTVIC